MPDGRREETCCGRARPAGRGTPEETRSALRHQLGLGRAPAPAPSPRILRPPELPLGAPSADGLTLEHVSIATEVGERCPLLLVRRASSTGPLRPVFVMHGTGGSNLSSLADGHLQLFANLGMLAVGVDSRHHGCRLDRGPGCCGARPPSYWDALIAAWRAPARAAGPTTSAAHAHPFIYDTCWDLMAVLDWLEGRDDVDCSRVGAFGKSLGGMHAWIWAAADTRVSACCPAIGVQCFDWVRRATLPPADASSIIPDRAMRRRRCATTLGTHALPRSRRSSTPSLLTPVDRPTRRPSRPRGINSSRGCSPDSTHRARSARSCLGRVLSSTTRRTRAARARDSSGSYVPSRARSPGAPRRCTRAHACPGSFACLISSRAVCCTRTAPG